MLPELKEVALTNLKFSLVIPEADGTDDYYWYVYRSNVVFAANTDDTGYRSTFALSERYHHGRNRSFPKQCSRRIITRNNNYFLLFFNHFSYGNKEQQ
jgi:hypothetical protein